MSDDQPETPAKAARVLIGGFALAFSFRAVDTFGRVSLSESIALVALAVMLAVVDYKLTWVLQKLGPRLSKKLNRVATDARWWIVIFLVLYVASYIPEGLSRLSAGTAPNVLIWGPLPSQYEGRPVGWYWDGAVLEANRGPDSTAIITAFDVYGQNFGPDEAALQNAYLISDLDGAKLEMQINSDAGYIAPNETAPIPVNAPLALQAKFAKPKPLSEAEFLKDWAAFTVVIEANGKTIRHDYKRADVEKWIDNAAGRQPHVSKRK